MGWEAGSQASGVSPVSRGQLCVAMLGVASPSCLFFSSEGTDYTLTTKDMDTEYNDEGSMWQQRIYVQT